MRLTQAEQTSQLEQRINGLRLLTVTPKQRIPGPNGMGNILWYLPEDPREEFLFFAEEILKGIIWKKKSIDGLQPLYFDDIFAEHHFEVVKEELPPEADQRTAKNITVEKPYERRPYFEHFVEGGVLRMIDIAHRVHLQPELSLLLIEVLEQASEWFEKNRKDVHGDSIEHTKVELIRRKNGEDTYEPQPVPALDQFQYPTPDQVKDFAKRNIAAEELDRSIQSFFPETPAQRIHREMREKQGLR